MAGQFDWALDVNTSWKPIFRLPGVDLTGGDSELALWDPSGSPAAWMGSAGRTQPHPAPAAVGSVSLKVVTDAPTLQQLWGSLPGPVPAVMTVVQALLDDAKTALLSGSYTYQWDYWNSQGDHFRALEGNVEASGRSMP